MPAPTCGQPVILRNGIEVGNIFKLGTKFTDASGATYLGEDGVAHPIVMGSYGIGVGRNVACIVEAHHDEKGIIWPAEVAPYAAHLVSIGAAKEPRVARGRRAPPRARDRRRPRDPVGRPRRIAGRQVHRRRAARDALDPDRQPALAGGRRGRGHRAGDGRARRPARSRTSRRCSEAVDVLRDLVRERVPDLGDLLVAQRRAVERDDVLVRPPGARRARSESTTVEVSPSQRHRRAGRSRR